MAWHKLVYPVVMVAWASWMYARHGWRAGYAMGPRGEVPIAHGGHATVVTEMRTRIGWPVWAILEIPGTRRQSFHLRPQPRLRWRRELAVGRPGFDAAFWIEPGSEAFVQALLERDPAQRHLMALRRWLAAERAKLSRVVAEDGKLVVEVHVRWVEDRPRLYRRLLAWMVELDRLLAAGP